MNRIYTLLLILTILLLTRSVQAQIDISNYFGQGQITLKDGTVLQDSMQYYLTSPDKIYMIEKETDERTEFRAADIKDFTLNHRQYFPISTRTGKIFAMLLTEVKGKFKVYVCEIQSAISGAALQKEYFVLAQGDNVAYKLTGPKYTPSKKLADLVSDCPELSQKIKNKEDNYTYPKKATDADRIEVLLKVAKDYQKCQ